jgi:ribosomal protein S18 acetylase RimI-like enzyme
VDGVGRLIERIEHYYDAAPRTAADAEQVGPFTLFVGRGTWSYYARPSPGATGSVTAEQVAALRARQRELDVPEHIEWQHDVTPSLERACAEAGMTVHRFRLMVHHGATGAPRYDVRVVGADDDLEALLSVQQQGFGGAPEVEPQDVAHVRERVEAGLTVVAAGFRERQPVCVGMHQPLDDVSEVVGVATLMQHRRQGWAAAVTDVLVADALARGVGTVFLSAAEDAVARVYERVGFVDVGVACAAEPTARPS